MLELIVDDPYTFGEAARVPLAEAAEVDRVLDGAVRAARAFKTTAIAERAAL